MSTNRTIVQNTLFLYFRMFFNMGVSLYTSRIILKTLGVDDYGIYNLVGGLVVLFSFLNSAMSSSTQRYLNYEIPSNDHVRINKVFCSSINIHLLICILVLILGETIGLWFLNHKLNIPDDRLSAANWVYQMSLLTAIVNITRIPYNSVIIAYQKMSFYAYVGILETFLKLLAVYLLLVFQGVDYLILYGVLLFFANIITTFIYRFYCIKKYKIESTYRFIYDKKLMVDMTSFSGWNLLGQVANVGASQGIAMVLNIFLGVAINAAMGIANQINVAIYSFISNFQIAFNPQITQTYAKGELKSHNNLVLLTSKMSFFLLAFLAFPVLVNTDFVLRLWLGNTLPQYVHEFTQIIIFISLIDALSGPFWMSAHAIGKIKKYQIYLSLILIFNVPLAYILLNNHASPTYVLICKLALNIIAFGYRFWYVKHSLKLEKQPILNYLRATVISFCVIVSVSYYLVEYNFIEDTYANFIIKSLLGELLLIILLTTLGLDIKEKEQLIKLIKNKLKKNVK